MPEVVAVSSAVPDGVSPAGVPADLQPSMRAVLAVRGAVADFCANPTGAATWCVHHPPRRRCS